jgi:hypothetical protein
MITYEVTAAVSPDLVPRYESYMRRHHIPALLATGCFDSARLSRGGPGEYRMQYDASDRAALERYLEKYAPALRAEFEAEFPSGITLGRGVWEVVQQWSGGPR